jgi:PEP-CTERM motif
MIPILKTRPNFVESLTIYLRGTFPMILRYKPFLLLSTTFASLLSLSGTTHAASFFDETSTSSGDFSNDPFTPTQIPTLKSGDNILSFTIDNPTPLAIDKSNRDLDYFYVTVPKKFVLRKLFLTQYNPSQSSTGGPSDEIAFIGIQTGTVFTEPPLPPIPPNTTFTDPSKLLGYTLIGSTNAANNFPSVNAPGGDLLPSMGLTGTRPNQPNGTPEPDPIGFKAPLPAGDYVFWAQQTAEGDVDVRLNFVVSPVPEPASILGLLAVGILGTSWLRKRQKTANG